MFVMTTLALKIDHLGLTFLCSPTWGGHTRRHFQKTHSARGETTWPLGQRQQPQAVYVKEARLQSELAKVPQVVREYGTNILSQLPMLIAKPHMTPKPPFGIPPSPKE